MQLRAERDDLMQFYGGAYHVHALHISLLIIKVLIQEGRLHSIKLRFLIPKIFAFVKLFQLIRNQMIVSYFRKFEFIFKVSEVTV